MDIAHRSLLKRSLVFTGRLALGVAVIIAGVSVGISLDPSGAEGLEGAYVLYLVEFLGGVGAGYVLKKHFFWVVSALICTFMVWMITPFIIDPSIDTGDFGPGFLIAMVLVWLLASVYLGGVLGYLLSRLVALLRAQRSIKTDLFWIAPTMIVVVGAQILLAVTSTSDSDHAIFLPALVLVFLALVGTPVVYLVPWLRNRLRARHQARTS